MSEKQSDIYERVKACRKPNSVKFSGIPPAPCPTGKTAAPNPTFLQSKLWCVFSR